MGRPLTSTALRLLPVLAAAGAAWIRANRDRCRRQGRALSVDELGRYGQNFEPTDLRAARVHFVDADLGARLPELLVGGLGLPLRRGRVAAIALEDTIIVGPPYGPDDERWPRLLFHELVHVVQYRLLGLDRFVWHYLDGWIRSGFAYSLIPLERAAYELERVYATDPSGHLDVSAEVRRRLPARP